MLEALPRGRPRAPRKPARTEPALARSSLSQQTVNEDVHSRKLRGPPRLDNKRSHVTGVQRLAYLGWARPGWDPYRCRPPSHRPATLRARFAAGSDHFADSERAQRSGRHPARTRYLRRHSLDTFAANGRARTAQGKERTRSRWARREGCPRSDREHHRHATATTDSRSSRAPP